MKKKNEKYKAALTFAVLNYHVNLRFQIGILNLFLC